MNRPIVTAASLALLLIVVTVARAAAEDNKAPEGFTPLFNGKDLAGWKTGKAGHWKVEDGVIVYDGKGGDLVTEKNYANFVLHVDWKIGKGADSGVYLRGTPQVQIWDNPEGSGGLWNNGIKALKKADRPLGEWNHFEIRVEKGLVTVRLNGEIVVDKADMKFKKPTGPIHLQNHGNPLWFKNIYVQELPE